ncbi:hypothetical protein, partial [uncultured Porphyromonas sp.]|uniref:leucine-rich repeat domain-containing protein n=1 Tax=uncultured Porphyromonas sp. TaxID=159274 RepID=UPI0028039D1F
MTRRLHHWACVLLCTLLTSIGLQAEESSQPSSTTSDALRTGSEGVITMTTTKAVGEKIRLIIEANGNVTIEGVKDPKGSTYTLTSQTVIIRGDVTKLNVLNNQLTNLDASGCTTLTSLKCTGNKRRFGNKLTSLDVSGCTALTELYCNDNQLTSLDVSSCTALTDLKCYDNQLPSLNISGCTALTTLECFNNKLTSLDVSSCTALTELNCYKNQLTALDLSQNTALKKLVCAKNKLAALDVSQNTALTWLYCEQNQLTTLDLSQNTALTELGCQQNQLTALDLSQNTALTELDCQQNQLAALDVSQNTALKKLKCSNNPLTALNVSKNTALTQLDCDNNQLTILDVSQNTALTWLDCDNNQLTALDLSQNTALTTLICHRNQLTALDVSQNTALTWLKCFENKLAALDVSQNTALTWLDCDNNQLTKLDVSQNTALRWLECHRNQLTALDVSKNTKLEALRCHGNQIKGEEMTRLVNSLPDRTGKKAGKFTVVQEPALEGNICLKSDVAIAKGKNWNTLKYKSDTRKYVPYEGAQTLKVTLTKEGEGTLTATGAADLNAVLEGTELTIVATPADGYKLTALTANGTDILATKKLSVREDTEIKATFAKKTFAVKLTKEGEGTITATGADDLNAVPYGTELTIVATPAEGYELTALTANSTDILATKKVTVQGATEVKATFTKKSFAVTLTKEGEGTITATGADDLNAVNYGTELTINATPAEGYELTALTANGTDILATKKLSVREDTEIKATFAKKTFVVKLTKEGEGTITATGADDLNAVNYGTELTINATPAEGYKLTALTANGTDILATKKLSVREDTEIKATFTKKTFAVKLTKEGEGTLTATGADDLNAVTYGTELTIVATPAEGYKLTALTANGTDILATKKLSVREDTEIKATFTKKTFAVKLTKEGEGTITATGADDLNAVNYGTELTINATPAEGYELTALTANGTDILASKKVTVQGATEVKATFTKKSFAVTLTKEGEGAITATGADDLNAVNYGTE